MELQFSVKINDDARDKNARSSGASTDTISPKGTTSRFALETRTRHTRRSSTRTRQGCSTCKKRHVKCDETRPSCLNCMRWRGYCDAYSDNGSSDTSNPSTTADAKLIHTKRAPVMLTEPSTNTVRFASSDQRAYFDEWTALSMTFLSGGLTKARLWTVTMPQLTLQEPILRFAAMAVGALRKAQEIDGLTSLSTTNKHYLNAIVYYCEALRLQSLAKPTKEGMKTALLSSLLFICFEAQQGNTAAALKHIMGGFSMLNELAACSDKAPDLVRIAPAPPALVQDVLDCFKPLELQSRSYMGSYRKPPTPPGQVSPSQAQPLPKEAPGGGFPASSDRSPPSQPGSPWQAGPSRVPEGAGLPSPTSQGSPQTSDGHPSPGGMPPKPPGISPFTRSSPYFRPRLSAITSLGDMPQIFQNLSEAQGYWTLVQRQMVQYLPLLTVTTVRLQLPRATNEMEVEAKLASVKQNPMINKFIADSRYWLQRWSEAFEPLFQSAARNSKQAPQLYLHGATLRIEYLILYIYTAIPRFSGLVTAKGLRPQYQEINVLAETLLASLPRCGFSMDSGWTWPLFISSFACRDPTVRDNAIRILREYPNRNALRDSRVFHAIALKNKEVESLNMEGSENEQWLRLRRREVVFEGFGNSVIFRWARKDVTTNRWDLIEEVSDSHVQPDGTLQWRQQTISNSASIMSGVC
ncbi:C6 zinc finger domain-containing protein [Stachybotrys elegans]|uniref:C6 zinc finger domain-containing protein n=1 Tax=Stachybotrys elegans TaxID=80388 RepID=A0A8K0SGN1_9HYPO|nr:C6 zinc finger domain-containing protein [Stachybotrys elegans]